MDYAIGRTVGTEVAIDDLVGVTDEQRLEMAKKALPLHIPLQQLDFSYDDAGNRVYFPRGHYTYESRVVPISEKFNPPAAIFESADFTLEQLAEAADKACSLPTPPPVTWQICTCLDQSLNMFMVEDLGNGFYRRRATCRKCHRQIISPMYQPLRSGTPPPERRFECVYCRAFCPIPPQGTMHCGRRAIGGEVKESKQ